MYSWSSKKGLSCGLYGSQPPEKKLTPFNVAKKIGLIFAVKVESDRIYNGRVNWVFEGIDYAANPAMINKVSYERSVSLKFI